MHARTNVHKALEVAQEINCCLPACFSGKSQQDFVFSVCSVCALYCTAVSLVTPELLHNVHGFGVQISRLRICSP